MSVEEQRIYNKIMTTEIDIRERMDEKLNEGMAIVIKNLYRSGMSVKEISDRCVMSETEVGAIINCDAEH